MKRKPIGKLISQIYRQNQKNLTKELKPFQIGGGGQHSFLIEILRCPGINQDTLTSELKFDKATTARAVKQLEEAGYIMRSVDENDRRAYRLYPTQKGLDFHPTLTSILDSRHQQLTQHLTKQEIDQLFTLLQKLH
ncbi:MarR family winged helix-turn-helix transcriptional regulator [Neobacillus jeddahensis]|uniref:MarR family winged helix-turn-helix transcriptional regulator n=1 Tax=Neobacillus jeddahensis TaxID=1461580 RepID=UPI00058B08B9|nr:MarR family transcriptional regulator [Neobacillus jeddahensis]